MTLVSRVQNILMSPNTEWPVIAAESSDVGSLYTSYIIPLAAIGPVALFLLQFLTHPSGIVYELVSAIVHYGLGLVVIYAVAFIAAKLAPSFGGRDDVLQGLKLIAYAATAVWVAEVFLLIPLLGPLVVLVALLYTIYLFFLGTSPVMGVAQDKSIVFVLVLFVIAIVLNYIVFAVVRTIA
jgi:hypothetical protein